MAPVSYTHLDVYKRQVVGLVCMLLFLIPNVIQRKIASLSLNTLLIVFVSLFVFVILFGNLIIILESPLV